MLKVPKINLKKYEIKTMKERKLGKNLNEKTIQITKKTNKDLNMLNIKQLTELMASQFKNAKVEIRGLNIHNWWTLKPLNDKLRFETEEEYYDGSVVDVDKFLNYSQIIIRVQYLKK